MLEDFFKVVKKRFNDGDDEYKPPMFKCPRCQELSPLIQYEERRRICPKCGYHGRLSAQGESLSLPIRTASGADSKLRSGNPINFPEYESKLRQSSESTGLSEAIITGTATIKGSECVLGVMDSRFLMGSMGSVVGEKVARAFEYATEHNLPVVMFTCSGGARMQEGIVSLMQMAKTSGAVKLHSDNGGLYIPVLTDPTTGGVTASFASLGDIIIAEPKVLVGFAGRRVIEDTIRQRLPEGFQLAEFQQDKGFVDMIVERRKMRSVLSHLLKLHGYNKKEV